MKKILIGIFAALAVTAGAEEWNVVASFDAARVDDMALASGAVQYVYPAGEIQEAGMGADDAGRKIVFGYEIGLAWAGAVPGAQYKIKAAFLCDSAERVQKIEAGGMVLEEKLALLKGRVLEKEWAVPAGAIKNGRLLVAIKMVSGPNAVLSRLQVLSGNPARLTAPPEPIIDLPRLSPRPAAVTGCADVSLDLGGTWKFNPAPPAGFASALPTGWQDIQVPGEWAMQGFEVRQGTAAGYFRTFTVPKDWAGKRIKLRADAVYSDAMVFINGKEAGKHSGGFTPFELDVTDLVKFTSENTIALSVLNETDADRLASGSQYACHPLGGITRTLRLFALPSVNLASLQITTRFDTAFRDATLGVTIEAAKEGAVDAAGVQALLSLAGPDGRPVALSPNRIPLNSLKGTTEIPVAHPAKWDNEHPHLYTLTVKLEQGGKVLETVTRRIGFRQVEVRGNELFVNGMPVKLRGSNHHEVYPVTGRSLPAGIDRRDIELFREANVNHLRTCHYPPDEALLEAADELGMFIECEAPFCWAPGQGDDELIVRQTAEMVLNYRNHPSVLFWSLANESTWGPHYAASSRLVRKLDPTRPQVFNDNGSKSDPKCTDLLNSHYPGHAGPAQARQGQPQPVYLGEDCHLNAYNRLELATDPALREIWGHYLREMWDDIYATKGALGQSIWSGVDDTFYLKDDQTVGYGTWGPIDGWRRPKPEYWGVKKAYSPVRILDSGSAGFVNGGIDLHVENRQNFSNLNEMKISWKLGTQTGVASADIQPGGKGTLSIRTGRPPKAGEKLELIFTDPRGFVADKFNLALAGAVSAPTPSPVKQPHPVKVTETADAITLTDAAAASRISKTTGQFISVNQLSLTGPQLMILPLNSDGDTQMTGKTKVWTPFTEPCSGWACSSVTSRNENGMAVVTVEGKYQGAEGSYTLTFGNGRIEIAYDFTITKDVSPRQVGLVFTLPRECEVFSWERKGYWDDYPPDDIARLKGSVKASEGFEATSVGPRTKPSHPWRLDKLPYGNNDFCSTKHNITVATLADLHGNGLSVDGQGKQHARCWQTDTGVHLLVADYSNGGSERFLRGLASKDDRPLKPGDKVSGTIRLSIRAGGD